MKLTQIDRISVGSRLPRFSAETRFNNSGRYTLLKSHIPWYWSLGCGCDQSIGSTVSDVIVRIWLWSTATRSSPLGYFGRLLQVVDNCPTFCAIRFSSGRLLAIEDFTLTSAYFAAPADDHCFCWYVLMFCLCCWSLIILIRSGVLLMLLIIAPGLLETGQCHPYSKGSPSFSVANYRPISITSVLYKVCERLVSVRLERFMERSGVLPTTQFVYRKGLGTCDALLCCLVHCKVHWRDGRRLGSCRLISAQPLIGSTIREFCISSVLWLLEVLCCLYWHSFYQIDHSMLWLTVV